jgi:hypothetical protein
MASQLESSSVSRLLQQLILLLGFHVLYELFFLEKLVQHYSKSYSGFARFAKASPPSGTRYGVSDQA